MMHQSLATIDSPEFINLQPLEINPLMSSCEIKVLYLGENRNHSMITKDVAMNMAKTLRGAPIVGYYKEEKEDFRDHGHQVIMDDEGIKFECLTIPYGFVSPDARVWFQKFEDTDEFGNKEIREYLMTTGYLWTGQYEEANLAIEKGRPQSMELDEDTLDGHWATNNKTGMDFFIINDAIFSKLCILGEDVEPCFEGANITAPQVSTSFSKIDDNFKKTLYTMMQDLQSALEGGKNMVLENEDIKETEFVENVEETEVVENNEEEVVENVENEEESVVEEAPIEENSVEDDNSEQSISAENQDSIEAPSNQEEFAKNPEDEENDDEDKDDKDDAEDSDPEEDKDEEEDKKKYALLESQYSELQNAYTALEEKCKELENFKNQVEEEKKDNLIDSFYMLSDEDKKDVKENKTNYSLEDIEAKLSVICVRKKVNFDLEDTSKNEDKVEEEKNENVTTFNVTSSEVSIPAWISAVKNTRDSRE